MQMDKARLFRSVCPLVLVALSFAHIGRGNEAWAIVAEQVVKTPALVDSLPKGVQLDELSSVVLSSLPIEPSRLELVRIEVTSDPMAFVSAGPQLIVIEHGSLGITDELGIEGDYVQSDMLSFGGGISYTLRATRGATATLLRAELLPSDSPSSESDGAVLLSGPVAGLPNGAGRFFLAQTVWPKGVKLAKHTFSGPVGLVSTDGIFTLTTPDGAKLRLENNLSVVINPDVVSEGAASKRFGAALLMVGVIPVDSALVLPVANDSDEAPVETPTGNGSPPIVPVGTDAETASGYAARSIESLLPSQRDVPTYLIVTGEGARHRDTITASFPDPVDAEAKFANWGWRESVYRTFGVAGDADARTDPISQVDVGAHLFASDSAAAEALDYVADARSAILSIPRVKVQQRGEQTAAISGPSGGTNEASVYIRIGSAVVRVTSYSMTSDPLPTSLSVADAIVRA